MTVLLMSYRRPPQGSGEELRYSLRSIQQNLLHSDIQLMMVGDEPPAWLMPDEWVRGNLSTSTSTGARIMENVLRGVQKLQDIAKDVHLGDVIYIDDDYFLLDPTSEVLVCDRGTLQDHVAKCQRDLRRGHWFTDTLYNTYAQLSLRGDVPLSFELHRPLPIDIDLVYETLSDAPENVFWRSWYGNGVCEESTFARDGRYVGRSMPLGVPWISSEDEAWEAWIAKKITPMFPTASRWER